ncbi:MAG: cell division protein ZapB [Ideonella sp.]|jgi:chromosome segregation ATPase|nr:cell division protein ZapB [Ideonella sp.]
MATLDDLAQRIDRLLMRHAEAMRTQALLEQELAAVTLERDSLKSRLQAARSRIEALLDRLPADGPGADGPGQPTAEVATERPATGGTP